MCEIGMVYDEISYMIRNVRHFAKEKNVRTPLAQFQFSQLCEAVSAGNGADYEPVELSVSPLPWSR